MPAGMPGRAVRRDFGGALAHRAGNRRSAPLEARAGTPDRVRMVGDNPEADIEGARAAGILVRPPRRPDPPPRPNGSRRIRVHLGCSRSAQRERSGAEGAPQA
ncbi:HAD hydrolase-like protein [Streptomyces sp. NPDC051940]|uniref:HAD hydrolase-like protein n=1 Tax=Streptomyces sp. NPDC051940 TaxID=3155675 RepID=UPI003428E115